MISRVNYAPLLQRCGLPKHLNYLEPYTDEFGRPVYLILKTDEEIIEYCAKLCSEIPSEYAMVFALLNDGRLLYCVRSELEEDDEYLETLDNTNGIGTGHEVGVEIYLSEESIDYNFDGIKEIYQDEMGHMFGFIYEIEKGKFIAVQ